MPGAVSFPVTPEVAFDYLADPANRASWQSSLARVADVDGGVSVGQTWTDVTKPGLRPRMRTTVLDRPHRWTETGTWRAISAELTLDFSPTETGCDVTPTMRLHATGLLAPLGPLLTRLSPYAVRADLRTAAGLLSVTREP